MEGLINAIRNDIHAANALAEMIESLEVQKMNGTLILTPMGAQQLEALKRIHNRSIQDIEAKRAVLAFFEQHNLQP